MLVLFVALIAGIAAAISLRRRTRPAADDPEPPVPVPDRIACVFCPSCQQLVPATSTTVTSDGVFCDACAANR